MPLDKKITELLDELMADGKRNGVDWDGYSVIEPVYNRKMYMGYPYVILIKGNDARICEPEEALKYLDHKLSLHPEEDD